DAVPAPELRPRSRNTGALRQHPQGLGVRPDSLSRPAAADARLTAVVRRPVLPIPGVLVTSRALRFALVGRGVREDLPEDRVQLTPVAVAGRLALPVLPGHQDSSSPESWSIT